MKKLLILIALLPSIALAQVIKISELPPVTTPLSGTEEYAAVQDGVTSRALTLDISSFVLSQLENAGLIDVTGGWTFSHTGTAVAPTIFVNATTPRFDFSNGSARFSMQLGSGPSLNWSSCLSDGNSCSNILSLNPGTNHVNVTGNFAVTGLTNGSVPLLRLETASNAQPPYLDFNTTDNAANARRWTMGNTGGTDFGVRACSDDGSTCTNAIQATRSGSNVAAVSFGNGTSNPAYLWAGNGPWTVGGGTGTAGQVLTSNGNAAAPSWQAAGGGGGVVQTTGTFTINWVTACTTTPTTDVRWVATGNTVTWRLDTNASCTSDSTSFLSSADVPVAIRPTTATAVAGFAATNNGSQATACLVINTDGTVSVRQSTVDQQPCAASATSWSATGAKSLSGTATGGGGQTATYLLN